MAASQKSPQDFWDAATALSAPIPRTVPIRPSRLPGQSAFASRAHSAPPSGERTVLRDFHSNRFRSRESCLSRLKHGRGKTAVRHRRHRFRSLGRKHSTSFGTPTRFSASVLSNSRMTHRTSPADKKRNGEVHPGLHHRKPPSQLRPAVRSRLKASHKETKPGNPVPVPPPGKPIHNIQPVIKKE